MKVSPEVKGWCPGAYHPMASGDGLVVRVRPWMGEISIVQARALAQIAEGFGDGTLELTSRANIQIRGVAEARHDAVIEALLEADLLDQIPALEGRRNLIMTPDWEAGDETSALARNLLACLPQLPDVSPKFGYAIDTGAAPWLAAAPADIRLERSCDGGLVLRADGAAMGRRVCAKTAIPALREMVDWFVQTGGRDAGRMARHLRQVPLPPEWSEVARNDTPRPMESPHGLLIGAPFGRIEAGALRALAQDNALKSLRVLPNRTLLVRGPSRQIPDGFCAVDDPALRVQACTGAAGCPQAHAATRPLARQLAKTLRPGETLHVSGCAKGCAFPRKADRTFVATRRGFDLVNKGAPWDAPEARDLREDEILAMMKPVGP